jgi:hypothetical protein
MAEDLLFNTIIAIIIILLIVYGIPSIVYLIISIIKGKDGRKVETLLENFKINSDNKNTMIYNSLNNEYFLFCTYMPIKKLVFCDNGRNKKMLEENDRDLKIVTEIFEIIKGIKKFCDNEYDRIKEKSDEKISENKAAREEREHQEELERKKEEAENSRHDSTSRLEWIKNIFSAIYSSISLTITTLTNVTQIAVKIAAIFGRIVDALAKNYVVTGFIILIFIIMVVLSWLKYSSVDTTTKEGGDNYKPNNGFSFSPFSIYYDMLDTYSYYSKIANNFNVSDYTANMIGISNDENNGVGDDDDTTYRDQLYGGKYDNLSYIKLNNLEIININDGSKDNIKTEKDIYYNIYLPSEKFKDLNEPPPISSLSWNVYETSKKEKIWKLDCESIDTIKADGNPANGKPAFITKGEKCIINSVGFNTLGLNKNDASTTDSDTPSIRFTTEYIK